MLRGPFMWIIAATLAACASDRAPASSLITCNPPPGVDALRANPAVKYIILGEHHGTNEMPALTVELVCDAALHGENVLLALEISADEQLGIDAYMSGANGGPGAIAASRFWSRGSDGRNSAAMLAMLARLRDLKHAGFAIDIVAADPPADFTPAQITALAVRFALPEGVDPTDNVRDLHMAARLMDEAARRNATLSFLLVGNAHAGTASHTSAMYNAATRTTRPYLRLPVSAALPRAETLAIVITHSGGASYSQTRVGSSTWSVQASEQTLQSPALVLEPFRYGASAYDGRIFIGPITSSPPAGAAETQP